MAITQTEKDGKNILRYEFQPKLEDGTPIGGIQVVEGATHEELMEKAANNYEHLYRKNRELIRKTELSGQAPTAVPQFTPRPLTPTERLQITRDINDPEKIDEALNLALEAKFGAKPEQFSKSVETNSRNSASIRAAQEAAAWRDLHPEFHASQQNVIDLATWIQQRNFEFTIDNFEKAYKELAPALEQAPSSPERTQETPPEAAPTGRIAGGDGTGQRQPPTSPSRRQATSRGTTKRDGVTVEQFRRMLPEERKRFIKADPNYKLV